MRLSDRAARCLSLLLFTAAMPAAVLGQPGSWLDRPLTNWNRPAGRPATLPEPPPVPDIAAPAICNEQLRKPMSTAERAILSRGWKLYGATQTFDRLQVVMATTGLDGMCRPLGYQAFIYWDGRYAGTLSPVAMNARADGALIDVHLVSATRIVAEFSRYAAGDAACCPSRTATVTYSLQPDASPTVQAESVTHRAACPRASEEPPVEPVNPAPEPPVGAPGDLTGKRWTLIEIEGESVNVDEPFIEFDVRTRRFTGSDGCNRFSGSYTVRGTSLTLGRPVGTKRACLDEAVRKLETRFNRALARVNQFEIQGSRLTLYDGRRRLMVLAVKGRD